MTNEFQHYPGCNHHDTANCGACALTNETQERPNYAAWPLAYMENGRTIPAKWKTAFFDELARTDNQPYVDNLRQHVETCGARFSDGTRAMVKNGLVVHG